MGSHSVTCHVEQVNTPYLNSRLVLDLPTPEGWKAEFTTSTMKSAVLRIIIHFLSAQLINSSNRKHVGLCLYIYELTMERNFGNTHICDARTALTGSSERHHVTQVSRWPTWPRTWRPIMTRLTAEARVTSDLQLRSTRFDALAGGRETTSARSEVRVVRRWWSLQSTALTSYDVKWITLIIARSPHHAWICLRADDWRIDLHDRESDKMCWILRLKAVKYLQYGIK